MYLERKIDNDLYIWQHNVNDVLVVQGPPCVVKQPAFSIMSKRISNTITSLI